MRTPLWLAPLALLAASCATPASPVADLRRRFFEEQDALCDGGCTDEEDLAHRRLWIARFRDLTRCGDPKEEDRAYECWALLLTNLGNAGYEEGSDRELLPLFLEWTERYPASDLLGGCLWMLIDGEEAVRAPGATALLERLARSPADGVARGALMARADQLECLGRAEETAPLLDEVLRRWPGSWEARSAGKELRALSLHPGTEAPDFVLPDMAGRTVSLASFRGRVVLLVFFGFG